MGVLSVLYELHWIFVKLDSFEELTLRPVGNLFISEVSLNAETLASERLGRKYESERNAILSLHSKVNGLCLSRESTRVSICFFFFLILKTFDLRTFPCVGLPILPESRLEQQTPAAHRRILSLTATMIITSTHRRSMTPLTTLYFCTSSTPGEVEFSRTFSLFHMLRVFGKAAACVRRPKIAVL